MDTNLKIVLAGCVVFAARAAPAEAQVRFGLELGTNRNGADYTSLVTATPEACLAQCQADTRCAAYTFVRTAASGSPNCWLKDSVPAASDHADCVSGVRGAFKDLALVSVNMKGHSAIPQEGGPDSVAWTQRYDQLAAAIARSGRAPDLISLTEVGGWEWCWVGGGAGDYEALATLIDGLAARTNVTYRIAYMVGSTSSYGGINRTRCQQFMGDAVLYNPITMVNRTPADAATRVVVPHDSGLLGLTLRRSLPICNPGSPPRDVTALIDGPTQTGKCGRPTPAAPAWALIDDMGMVIGSLGRFSFAHDTRDSFDLFTVHPPAGSEAAVSTSLADFIAGLSISPFRVAAPAIRTLVAGDLNALVGTSWLPGFGEIASVQQVNPAITNDPMGILQGAAQGSATHRVDLQLRARQLLPKDAMGCGPFTTGGHFSDHCGLRIDWRGPSSQEHADCPNLRTRERELAAEIESTNRALTGLGTEQQNCQNGSEEGGDGRPRKPRDCIDAETLAEKRVLESSLKAARAALLSVKSDKQAKACWN